MPSSHSCVCAAVLMHYVSPRLSSWLHRLLARASCDRIRADCRWHRELGLVPPSRRLINIGHVTPDGATNGGIGSRERRFPVYNGNSCTSNPMFSTRVCNIFRKRLTWRIMFNPLTHLRRRIILKKDQERRIFFLSQNDLIFAATSSLITNDSRSLHTRWIICLE